MARLILIFFFPFIFPHFPSSMANKAEAPFFPAHRLPMHPGSSCWFVGSFVGCLIDSTASSSHFSMASMARQAPVASSSPCAYALLLYPPQPSPQYLSNYQSRLSNGLWAFYYLLLVEQNTSCSHHYFPLLPFSIVRDYHSRNVLLVVGPTPSFAPINQHAASRWQQYE